MWSSLWYYFWTLNRNITCQWNKKDLTMWSSPLPSYENKSIDIIMLFYCDKWTSTAMSWLGTDMNLYMLGRLVFLNHNFQRRIFFLNIIIIFMIKCVNFHYLACATTNLLCLYNLLNNFKTRHNQQPKFIYILTSWLHNFKDI